jgi:G:T-mismatch repair DNA endonuclease (very short patch repair protein)
METNECYNLLCEIYGAQDVERWKSYHGWSFDFYIQSLDVYVQFDGVYWHGLDRPIEEIANSMNESDKGIYKKWKRDRKQDEWFDANSMKLVRIIECEFKSFKSNDDKKTLIESKIRSALGG